MSVSSLLRPVASAAIVVALVLPLPASAQFGGLIGRARDAARSSNTAETQPSDTQASQSSDGGCESSPSNSIGRSILGGMVRDMVGRTGLPSRWVPTREVAGVLTDAIACRLDPEEQTKAADATLEATRGEDVQVGSTASWNSETRENVSGTSTVTNRNDMPDGTSCLNVTDVVIVDGEETMVNKRMCRAPGEPRYTVVA